jgi:hypothetical protein
MWSWFHIPAPEVNNCKEENKRTVNIVMEHLYKKQVGFCCVVYGRGGLYTFFPRPYPFLHLANVHLFNDDISVYAPPPYL